MNSKYDEKYYSDRYINLKKIQLQLKDLFYLYVAYFCIIRPGRIKRGMRALDVGCGIGNLVWALRKFGIDAYGIEPSRAAQPHCRIPQYCRYTSTEKLPYKDNEFDLIYSNEVLEHIDKKNMAGFLEEMHRVSKGIMIHMLCTTNRGLIINSDATHLIFEDEVWWKKFFTKEGFAVSYKNFFYFFPPYPKEIIKGNLLLSGVRSGYFLLEKKKVR